MYLTGVSQFKIFPIEVLQNPYIFPILLFEMVVLFFSTFIMICQRLHWMGLLGGHLPHQINLVHIGGATMTFQYYTCHIGTLYIEDFFQYLQGAGASNFIMKKSRAYSGRKKVKRLSAVFMHLQTKWGIHKMHFHLHNYFNIYICQSLSHQQRPIQSHKM